MKRNARRMIDESKNIRIAQACRDVQLELGKIEDCVWKLRGVYGGRDMSTSGMRNFLNVDYTQSTKKPDTKRRAAEVRKLPESVLDRFYWVGNKTARLRILRDLKRDDPFAKSIIGRHTADVAEEILFQYDRASKRRDSRLGRAVDLVTPVETVIQRVVTRADEKKKTRRVHPKRKTQLNWPDHTIVLP